MTQCAQSVPKNVKYGDDKWLDGGINDFPHEGEMAPPTFGNPAQGGGQTFFSQIVRTNIFQTKGDKHFYI